MYFASFVKYTALGLTFSFMVSSCTSSTNKKEEKTKATAALLSPQPSKLVGTVTFTQINTQQTEIEGIVTGLAPRSTHGMHIHAIGDCSDGMDGFKKSGGHYNPDAMHHGSLMDGHAGDLGNIVADEKGVAKFKIETSKFILEGKKSILGKALVVHASEDDEKTDPAGNSGKRILCGVIK